jgi:hypothetical protein
MTNITPPPHLLPVLSRLKSSYIVWYNFYATIPKIHRHTLGERIDRLFIETTEAITTASFLPKTEKLPWIKHAIKKLDTLKFMLIILWETKSIDNKKYICVSILLEEIGKMLGGWNGQLVKQNSSQNN